MSWRKSTQGSTQNCWGLVICLKRGQPIKLLNTRLFVRLNQLPWKKINSCTGLPLPLCHSRLVIFLLLSKKYLYIYHICIYTRSPWKIFLGERNIEAQRSLEQTRRAWSPKYLANHARPWIVAVFLVLSFRWDVEGSPFHYKYYTNT